MSEQKISMDKKYRTRDGLPVRLLCVDAIRDECVIGLVKSTKTGQDHIYTWWANGDSFPCAKHPMDLVEITEPRYRPFFADELPALVGRVVVSSSKGTADLIRRIDTEAQSIYVSYVRHSPASLLKDGWTFRDTGEPCGVRCDE